MHNYFLPQKGWELIFPDQNEASGAAIAPIGRCMGRSEAPKALSEFHRRVPQGNPVTLSDILDNPEKSLAYRGFPVTADENRHRIWILNVKIHYTHDKPEILGLPGLSRVSGFERWKWISDSDYTSKSIWIPRKKAFYFLYAVKVNYQRDFQFC